MLHTARLKTNRIRNTIHTLEDNLEVTYNTPHFTAAKHKQHRFYYLKWALTNFTFSASSLGIINLE